MNVRTNLMLPPELVAQVDRVAGPRGRSRFVAKVLEEALRQDARRKALRAGVGMLAGKRGYEHWSTPERVVEWVREMRASDRDPWSE